MPKSLTRGRRTHGHNNNGQHKKRDPLMANVTSYPYRFGGIEFRVHNRDMGHIHGEKLADLPFPDGYSEGSHQLPGKALPHVIYPESMWVSLYHS